METQKGIRESEYSSPNKTNIAHSSSNQQKPWFLYSSQPDDLVTPPKYYSSSSNKKYPATQQFTYSSQMMSPFEDQPVEQVEVQNQPSEIQNQEDQNEGDNPEIAPLEFNRCKHIERGIGTSRYELASYFSVEQEQFQEVMHVCNKISEESTDKPQSVMSSPKKQFVLKNKREKYDSKCQCSLM